MPLFGLIGFPLSHSFSKKYFTEKFEKEELAQYRYENFPIDTIQKFPGILEQNPELQGLNVTIPYKEAVIPYLTKVTNEVIEIGACNCIKISKGHLEGFNTDVTGFRESFQVYLKPHHQKALVLGTGGASKAVAYVLGKLGIDYKLVSRQPNKGQFGYTEISEEIVATHHIIVNTTPLGMQPKTNIAPEMPYQYLTPQHYLFDVVYNPSMTLFLQMGKEKGAIIQNGSEMLRIQAEESWRIWNQE